MKSKFTLALTLFLLCGLITVAEPESKARKTARKKSSSSKKHVPGTKPRAKKPVAKTGIIDDAPERIIRDLPEPLSKNASTIIKDDPVVENAPAAASARDLSPESVPRAFPAIVIKNSEEVMTYPSKKNQKGSRTALSASKSSEKASPAVEPAPLKADITSGKQDTLTALTALTPPASAEASVLKPLIEKNDTAPSGKGAVAESREKETGPDPKQLPAVPDFVARDNVLPAGNYTSLLKSKAADDKQLTASIETKDPSAAIALSAEPDTLSRHSLPYESPIKTRVARNYTTIIKEVPKADAAGTEKKSPLGISGTGLPSLDTLVKPAVKSQQTYEAILTYLSSYIKTKYKKTFDSYLFVSIRQQRMYHIVNNEVVKVYLISGSKKGVGNKYGSNKTPLGLHSIVEKHGYNAPKGGLMVERNYTGKVLKIHNEKFCVGSDDVTTRVLWLKGEEPGLNQGGNIDSYKRFIYIHGTPEEGLIGVPSSDGCIRMKNNEVIELFGYAYVGMKVLILDEL
jgi:hypothetical protein